MPDSSNQRHGGRYGGLRDLQKRAPRRQRGDGSAARAGAAKAPAGDERGGRRGRGDAAERLAGLKVPRRQRWPRRLLGGLTIGVAVCLIGGLALFGYVDYRLGQVHRISVSALTASSGGPFTLLIVGSDSRDLGSAGGSQFGSQSEVSGERSDTVMLIRVVPATSSMTILSIPRDLWVSIKGLGDAKINAAFGSGAQLLIQTIQSDLGIPINHYMEFNFNTFREITDAVGGVKLYFPTPARDLYSLLSVPKAGCVNLTGNQALAFVRSRHYEYKVDGKWVEQGLSDLARIQRQQAFVKKMIKKAETKFTDPIALNTIIGSIAKNLTVDKGFSSTLMISLAEDFRHADVAGIPTETLPTNNYDVDDQEALSLQQPAADNMIKAFNDLGTATAKKAPAKKVKPSSVSVEVANGSGINNQAAEAAAAIAKLGYKATVTDSTPGYGFTGNEIEYAPDSLAAAKALSSSLAGGATLVESASLTPTPYNLELITGADYAGTGHAAKKAPSAPASTTTTTYLLPGPQPTAAELANC